jgi:hypothetical protein
VSVPASVSVSTRSRRCTVADPLAVLAAAPGDEDPADCTSTITTAITAAITSAAIATAQRRRRGRIVTAPPEAGPRQRRHGPAAARTSGGLR